MAHVGSVPSRHVLSGVPNTNRRLCLLFQVQPGVSPLPGAGAGALGQHRVRLRHVSTLCRARAAPQDRHISQPFTPGGSGGFAHVSSGSHPPSLAFPVQMLFFFLLTSLVAACASVTGYMWHQLL